MLFYRRYKEGVRRIQVFQVVCEPLFDMKAALGYGTPHGSMVASREYNPWAIVTLRSSFHMVIYFPIQILALLYAIAGTVALSGKRRPQGTPFPPLCRLHEPSCSPRSP